MKEHSSTRPFFWKLFLESSSVQEVSGYSVFTFEPRHNLCLGMHRSAKKCKVSYLYSERCRTRVVQRQGRLFQKVGVPVVQGCNLFLISIQSDAESPGTSINFSEEGMKRTGRTICKLYTSCNAEGRRLLTIGQGVFI